MSAAKETLQEWAARNLPTCSECGTGHAPEISEVLHKAELCGRCGYEHRRVDYCPPAKINLTVKEYAQVKRVTPRTVYEWLLTGKLRESASKGPGGWRIDL